MATDTGTEPAVETQEEPPLAPEDQVEEPTGQQAIAADRPLTNRVTGSVPNHAEITLKGGKADLSREFQRQDVVTFIVRGRCLFVGLRDIQDKKDPTKREETVRVHEFAVESITEMDEDMVDSLEMLLAEQVGRGVMDEDLAAEVAARAEQITEQDRLVREAREQTAEVDWPDGETAPERRVMCAECGELAEMEPVLQGESDDDRFISSEEHGCGDLGEPDGAQAD